MGSPSYLSMMVAMSVLCSTTFGSPVRIVQDWQQGRSSSLRAEAAKMIYSPEEMVSHPDEVISHPDEVISHPDEVISHPDEVISNPDEVISHPDEVISNPDEAISGPDDSRSTSAIYTLLAAVLGGSRSRSLNTRFHHADSRSRLGGSGSSASDVRRRRDAVAPSSERDARARRSLASLSPPSSSSSSSSSSTHEEASRRRRAADPSWREALQSTTVDYIWRMDYVQTYIFQLTPDLLTSFQQGTATDKDDTHHGQGHGHGQGHRQGNKHGHEHQGDSHEHGHKGNAQAHGVHEKETPFETEELVPFDGALAAQHAAAMTSEQLVAQINLMTEIYKYILTHDSSSSDDYDYVVGVVVDADDVAAAVDAAGDGVNGAGGRGGVQAVISGGRDGDDFAAGVDAAVEEDSAGVAGDGADAVPGGLDHAADEHAPEDETDVAAGRGDAAAAAVAGVLADAPATATAADDDDDVDAPDSNATPGLAADRNGDEREAFPDERKRSGNKDATDGDGKEAGTVRNDEEEDEETASDEVDGEEAVRARLRASLSHMSVEQQMHLLKILGALMQSFTHHPSDTPGVADICCVVR